MNDMMRLTVVKKKMMIIIKYLDSVVKSTSKGIWRYFDIAIIFTGNIQRCDTPSMPPLSKMAFRKWDIDFVRVGDSRIDDCTSRGYLSIEIF